MLYSGLHGVRGYGHLRGQHHGVMRSIQSNISMHLDGCVVLYEAGILQKS